MEKLGGDTVEFIQQLLDCVDSGRGLGRVCQSLCGGVVSRHIEGMHVQYEHVHEEKFTTFQAEVAPNSDLYARCDASVLHGAEQGNQGVSVTSLPGRVAAF
jgi:hypothetical protein